MSNKPRVAILVGGGPAPGINSVVSAATIRCILDGMEVLGIREGFSHIMKGDTSGIETLTIRRVSRIHFMGGSYLGTSRANPTKNPEHADIVVRTLLDLGVSALITIGGDDTAFSARVVSEKAGDRIRVVHVPKTIDNDLVLRPGVDTFGYQTARHLGVHLVKNLMVDAQTTSRWYFVIAMGRKAGHLALGIGKAAGATLTLIPEEFSGDRIAMKEIVDTLASAIIKRLSEGHSDGVAVLAEGVVLGIDPEELTGLEGVERDEHGHIRLSEIDLGPILKQLVKERLAELGIKTTIVSTNLGYELRCVDPTPFDMEYTRDLGYSAAKFLLAGGSDVMVSMQHGHFVPIPFEDLIDPVTGRTKVRMVDTASVGYSIARRYMIRLRRDDFEDDKTIDSLANTCGLTADQFREQFEYIIANEPPPPHWEALAKATSAGSR